MKVSIIVPIYNVSGYIKRCLDSVAGQIHPDIECILVNDGSTDNSMDLVNDYLSVYSGHVGFRIHNLNKNRGLSVARNIGLENASGKYVYFLDSDDEITIDCISELVMLSEKYTNVDVVHGNNKIIDPENRGELYLNISALELPEYSDDPLWIKKTLLTILPATPVCKLIRRELLVDHGIWFKEGIIHEDNHWRFFLSKHVRTIAISKVPAYIYHINENSIMTNPDKRRSYNDMLLLVEDCLLHVDPVLKNIQLTLLLRLLLSRKLTAPDDLKDPEKYNQLYNQFVMRVRKTDANIFTKLSVAYLKLPSFLLRKTIIRKFFGLWMRLYDKTGPQ